VHAWQYAYASCYHTAVCLEVLRAAARVCLLHSCILGLSFQLKKKGGYMVSSSVCLQAAALQLNLFAFRCPAAAHASCSALRNPWHMQLTATLLAGG
jgi:hypothetical protein